MSSSGQYPSPQTPAPAEAEEPEIPSLRSLLKSSWQDIKTGSLSAELPERVPSTTASAAEGAIAPEAQALGARLAFRAFAYGTLLALTSVSAGVALIAYKMEVRSIPEFSEKMKKWVPEKMEKLNQLGLKDSVVNFRNAASSSAFGAQSWLVPFGDRVKQFTSRFTAKKDTPESSPKKD
eukprot:ANDGO_07141.mRNA.1 hypothetical protein